ncbi:hypothetical protein [Amycolatopsis magusensis]|uniref:hypothetical protein n=1 Tax=Amycolatopsis magusensis TaxID=882444 RepID=UPI0024A92B7A|nr:hypothetical protein [Amycolatopsis magusensis]MDI5980112.1 hypothetical protein [Amycolatopsis magusensis]
MGWFSSRDPDDPHQLAIAVHELGHAFAWSDHGLPVAYVKHSGSDGVAHLASVTGYSEAQMRAYAVGMWAGFEAEDRWRRAHNLSGASKSHSRADIANFHAEQARLAETGIRLSEGKARSLARQRIAARWSRIQTLAPELICKGCLHVQ